MTEGEIIKKEARELRDLILKLIKELDDHHYNVNVAKATGNAVSAFGGTLAVTSAITAGLTAGATLPLVGAGLTMAAGGGIIDLGASLTEHCINYVKQYHLQEKWDTFENDFLKYYDKESSETSIEIQKTIRDIINGVFDMNEGYKLIKNRASKASRLRAALAVPGASPVCRVTRSIIEGVKVVGKRTVFLNALLVPISLQDLVQSANAASSGESSNVSAKLKNMADFLNKVVNDEL